MRVLLGAAMAAAGGLGLASMAHLDCHFHLAGAAARVYPGRDRPGHHLHRPGLGSAGGGGALRRDGRRPGRHAAPGRHRHRRGRAGCSLRLPGHHRHPARPGLPARPARRRAPPGRRRGLRAGTPVAALAARRPAPAVTRAARAGTASGLNYVLLAVAVFAALCATAGFAYGRDPARQPPPSSAAGDHGDFR